MGIMNSMAMKADDKVLSILALLLASAFMTGGVTILTAKEESNEA
jgi:hypothetical protein